MLLSQNSRDAVCVQEDDTSGPNELQRPRYLALYILRPAVCPTIMSGRVETSPFESDIHIYDVGESEPRSIVTYPKADSTPSSSNQWLWLKFGYPNAAPGSVLCNLVGVSDEIDISVEKLTECLQSGKYSRHIGKMVSTAEGGQGSLHLIPFLAQVRIDGNL